MSTIGEMIKKRRKILNFTQQELAGKLNISSQAVSKWENGVALPDLGLMPRLAQVLETSVDGLLGYQGPRSANMMKDIRENSFTGA